MTRTLLAALALLLGCAGTPEPVERSTRAVFSKDIAVVRAAAMSALMRMHVTVAALAPESTRMAVSARGAPADDALACFVDGMEGVLGRDAQGWQPPR